MKNKFKNIFLKNELIKKGFNSSKYYLIANIGTKLLGFLVLPILAHSVSVEQFAEYDLFLIISLFIQVLVTLGIDSGLGILISEKKDDKELLSFFYVITQLISILCLFFVMFCVITFFKLTSVDELFLLDLNFWYLIGVYTFFSIINYHTFNFFRWIEKAKEAAFINLLSYVFGIIIGLIVLLYCQQIIYYLIGLIIGTFLGTLFSLYISRSYIVSFRIIPNAKNIIKEMLFVSLPFLPNYLANKLMQMSDRIIIILLFGKYELGIYAIFMRLAMIPQFLAGTITGGFLPVMYNNFTTKFGENLIRLFFNTYIIVIPILFIITSLISENLILLFAGDKYLDLSYLLPISITAILFINGTQGIGFGFMIEKKTKLIVYITSLGLIFNFLFSIIFGVIYGLAGIIIGTLLAGILRMFVHIHYSEKLYSFNYNIKLLFFISFIIIFMSFYILK